MEWFMVTLNGHPLRKMMTKKEAHAMAERWQGSHGGYHGGSGLLKIKDRRDHVEVKVDHDSNKETHQRWLAMKAGDHQQIVMQQRVERMADADEVMRG